MDRPPKGRSIRSFSTCLFRNVPERTAADNDDDDGDDGDDNDNGS